MRKAALAVPMLASLLLMGAAPTPGQSWMDALNAIARTEYEIVIVTGCGLRTAGWEAAHHTWLLNAVDGELDKRKTSSTYFLEASFYWLGAISQAQQDAADMLRVDHAGICQSFAAANVAQQVERFERKK